MKSITPEAFRAFLLKHLSGISFFEDAILKIEFNVTHSGVVRANAIDNLKIILILAIKGMLPEHADSKAFYKLKTALRDLLPYGTSVTSSRTKQFLHQLEEDPSKISVDVKYGVPKEIMVHGNRLTEEEINYLIPLLSKIINNACLHFNYDAPQN
jgi:hypothetical protein